MTSVAGKRLLIYNVHIVYMLVVKDSVTLIHLAKTSLLRDSCRFLGDVLIPEKVYDETVESGREEGYPDAALVEEVVEEEDIEVREVEEEFVDRARKYSIQGGEAEAVGLYWQEDADLLATDDDNVRKKKTLLELDLIGTPVIVQKLYENGYIEGEKELEKKIDRLRDIGWFNSAVLDKIVLEAEKQ